MCLLLRVALLTEHSSLRYSAHHCGGALQCCTDLTWKIFATGVVGSLVVGMLLTCAAFWCFIAACITGFMCAGAGFGMRSDPAKP